MKVQRREFLKQLGIGLGVAMLPPIPDSVSNLFLDEIIEVDSAFMRAVKSTVDQNMAAMLRRLELSMLYGVSLDRL